MRFAVLGLLALAAGCSSLYHYEPESYVVRRGDTLYSIAFSRGLDFRELAAWNGLADPGRIRVGQRLVLYPTRGASAPVTRPASASTSAPANPRAGTDQVSPRTGADASPRPGAAEASRRATAARSASSPASPSRPVPAGSSMPAWRWPVTGPVVSRFGANGQLATGISIGGGLGDGIVAAAAGRVVYVGSGLPDYGELVIVQHNDVWLTAYGHNRRVLVNQGDAVASGQKIAEMGRGPGGEPRLHFEIRRNGDPLDPLALLPASN